MNQGNRTWRVARWVLACGLLLAAGAAPAAVAMNGEVTLDYYVADVDADGFEYAAADLFVERVDNDSTTSSGPLSLSGWATSGPSPAGDGDEIGYDPLGRLSGNSAFVNVYDTVDAEDLPPGEYYTHVLLQDDDFPDTYEDARSLVPRMLWRGGLEATGPLDVLPYSDGRRITVDFATLRNNRLDARYTNDIVLTLYATYGYGPASEGYTLCRAIVPGLYAGDVDVAPDFDCTIGTIPDGDYTLHLEVAESGGRGGSSTLSGPDITFRGDRVYDGYCCGDVYVAGALDAWAMLPLMLVAGWGRPGRRRVPAGLAA
jgi:hypothetical protein